MIWMAPTGKASNKAALEKHFWDAAVQLLTNPLFNVNAVGTAMRMSTSRHPEGQPQDLLARQDLERFKDTVGPGRDFPFGLPRTDNTTATRANAKTTLAKPNRRGVGKTGLYYLSIEPDFARLQLCLAA